MKMKLVPQLAIDYINVKEGNNWRKNERIKEWMIDWSKVTEWKKVKKERINKKREVKESMNERTEQN